MGKGYTQTGKKGGHRLTTIVRILLGTSHKQINFHPHDNPRVGDSNCIC